MERATARLVENGHLMERTMARLMVRTIEHGTPPTSWNVRWHAYYIYSLPNLDRL